MVIATHATAVMMNGDMADAAMLTAMITTTTVMRLVTRFAMMTVATKHVQALATRSQ